MFPAVGLNGREWNGYPECVRSAEHIEFVANAMSKHTMTIRMNSSPRCMRKWVDFHFITAPIHSCLAISLLTAHKREFRVKNCYSSHSCKSILESAVSVWILGMAALKFFTVVVALLLCASLGAGYNCTRRYQRLLREAATVKAQCPNAALRDCCQVGLITFCVLFNIIKGGSLQPLMSSVLT